MKRREAGFTLIELLTVVGIIMILAAISVPAISEYLRNYKIRGALQQVTGQIQAARTKSIMRNVNRATLFVVLPDTANPAIFTRYQWVVPEQLPPFSNLTVLLALPAQAGPVNTLPVGMNFLQNGVSPSLGFSRLGALCVDDPPNSTCAAQSVAQATIADPPPASLACPNCIAWNPATGASVSILQAQSGLQLTVTVNPGGRVMAQP